MFSKCTPYRSKHKAMGKGTIFQELQDSEFGERLCYDGKDQLNLGLTDVGQSAGASVLFLSDTPTPHQRLTWQAVHSGYREEFGS